MAHHKGADVQQQRKQKPLFRPDEHRDEERSSRQNNRGNVLKGANRVDGEGDKQRREREIQALDLRGNERPCKNANHAGGYPCRVIGNLHGKETRLCPAFGARCGDRIGLVDQGIHGE